MLCENYIQLVGKLLYPEYKDGNGDYQLFKAKLGLINEIGATQYLKITAWGLLAEQLSILPKGVYLKIQGHIEEKSYNSPCKFCGGQSKKYYSEIIVDNFIILEET